MERNHKINKRVLNSLQCRLSHNGVEKQVIVACNWAQLERLVTRKRNEFYLRPADQIISKRSTKVGSAGLDGDECKETEVDHITDGNILLGSNIPTPELLIFEPILTKEKNELEHNVWNFEDPVSIIDKFLIKDDKADEEAFSWI